jgi:uncharacterized damage-inducible protein DinB
VARSAIAHFVYLLDRAFSEPHSSDGDSVSLLANLEAAPDAALAWTPTGGSRSIVDIAVHAGAAKRFYHDHAFGRGSLRWEDAMLSRERAADRAALVAWLEAGHKAFRQAVAGLADDAGLLALRKAPWGEQWETRRIIAQMIEHDIYHAGEINHIRALFEEDDAWAFEQS